MKFQLIVELDEKETKLTQKYDTRRKTTTTQGPLCKVAI